MGWLKGFDQYPELSRLLARMVLEAEPTATFTSIWVSHNSMRPLHQDLNNDEWTDNYVIPLQNPESGGELWTETESVDLSPRGWVVEAVKYMDKSTLWSRDLH